MKAIYSVIFLLLAGVAQASTVTIDFEEFELSWDEGEQNSIPVPFVSQGFQFTGFANGTVAVKPTGSLYGSNSLSIYGQGLYFNSDLNEVVITAHAEFERTDGQAFSLWSFDQFMYYGSVIAIGTLANGDTIVTYDSTQLGQGDWLNVVKVALTGTEGEFGGNSFEIDNIVVGAAAVPVPAAAWLFGSALAGLGWMRRRN